MMLWTVADEALLAHAAGSAEHDELDAANQKQAGHQEEANGEDNQQIVALLTFSHDLIPRCCSSCRTHAITFCRSSSCRRISAQVVG